jgi:hypothetical protein
MAQGFYGGYMGNAGALSDLVYRGNPGQMTPMPYYGGGIGVQQLGGFTGPAQLSTDVIEASIPGSKLMAGGPSFDINPGAAGDSRRSRKGLSPQDVQRLINANPQFEQQIRDMYLPGVQGTPFFKKASLPANFDAKYVS